METPNQQSVLLVFTDAVRESDYQLWFGSQARKVDVFMLMILLANVVGRSLMNPEIRFSTIGMSILAIAVVAALVTAMRWPNWYLCRRETLLLTVWLVLGRAIQAVVAYPPFLAAHADDCTHPVWLGRLSGMEPMVSCSLALRVRFIWSLPAVAMNMAAMMEVAREVCRGPGLAMYPLPTCRAATLAFQVIAGTLTLACIWVLEARSRRWFLQQRVPLGPESG